jgi:heterodisulfide reductase subunit A-like polyferredoxin
MRGMQKYLIVHKTNILLHFPGIRHIGSDNEEFYCNSKRRRWKSNGRIQEVQVNEKENDTVIE